MEEFNPYTSDPFASDSSENGDNPYNEEAESTANSYDDLQTGTTQNTTYESVENSTYGFTQNSTYESASDSSYQSAQNSTWDSQDFVTQGNPNANTYYNPEPTPTNVYSGAKGNTDGRNLAIASLVIGILGFATFCFCVGEVFGIVAIVLGSVYLSKYEDKKYKSFAVGGIVTGAISLITFISIIIFAILSDESGTATELTSGISDTVDSVIEDFDSKLENGIDGYADENIDKYIEEYTEEYTEDFLDLYGDGSKVTNEIKEGTLKDFFASVTSVLSDEEEPNFLEGNFYDYVWLTDYTSMRGWITVECYEYKEPESYIRDRDDYNLDVEKDRLNQFYGVKKPKGASGGNSGLVFGVDEEGENLYFLTSYFDDKNIVFNVTAFTQNEDDVKFMSNYFKYLHEKIGIKDFSKEIN